MFSPPPHRSPGVRLADAFFLVLGLAVLIILTTRYQMPFRLDDVLHMDWAREHSLLDAFHPVHGEIVRSVRPLFAATIWILTHTAGTESYFAWHLTLVATFLIGLTFTGLTARYIAQRASAFYITVTIFWLAFLSILNVLFWFGDLTFSIELMFVAAAWYYGLRGLCEGKLKLWLIGCFLGICAVLSKEPAIVMVNAVFVGSFAFYPREIAQVWKQRPRSHSGIAILGYLLFLAVCLLLFFASPTRSNRFFSLSETAPDLLNFFIGDRLRYYGDILTAPLTRFLLLLPLYYVLVKSLQKLLRQPAGMLTASITIIASLLLGVVITQPLVVLAVFIVTPVIAYFSRWKEAERSLLVLPFSFCMVIIFSVLLITVMLVKTQLTELAFCAIIVSGVYWSACLADLAQEFRQLQSKRRAKLILAGGCIGLIVAAVFLAGPKLASREQLLREVQATRLNANNAIKWMARTLPPESTVLVTAPSLHGTARESDLTSVDDETKAFAQYTFLQGFVGVYFQQLNRPDLRIAYLEDTLMLHQVLTALRETDHTYLFLQNGRDRQRFHDKINGRQPLAATDSMVAEFTQGSYPSEVWELGN